MKSNCISDYNSTEIADWNPDRCMETFW